MRKLVELKSIRKSAKGLKEDWTRGEGQLPKDWKLLSDEELKDLLRSFNQLLKWIPFGNSKWVTIRNRRERVKAELEKRGTKLESGFKSRKFEKVKKELEQVVEKIAKEFELVGFCDIDVTKERAVFTAELDYEDMEKVIEELDKVLYNNGVDAYFDMEMPGRASAIFWDSL